MSRDPVSRMAPPHRNALWLVLMLAAPIFSSTAQPTIYWSNTYSGTLQRAVAGGNVQDLIEGFVDRPHSLRLDIDDDKIYWALAVQSSSPNNAIVQRSALDGSSLESLVFSGFCNPYCPVTAMTFDAARDSLYWSTWDGSFPAIHRLRRSDAAGSDVTILNTFENVVLDIDLDRASGQLYWIDGKLPGVLADHAILRATLAGSNPEQVLHVFDGKPVEEGHLAVDRHGGKVYWVTHNRAIRRANLDGTDREDLVGITGDPDSTRFGDLALDVASAKMYWSVTYGGVNTFPAGVIHRANLDGSDVEEIVRVEPGGIGAFAIDFSGIVGRETVDEVRNEFSLGAAYPNPARSSAIIPFTLEVTGPATLSLWDLTGRRVRTVAAGLRAAGRHEVEVPTNDLPSGLYVYRLETTGAIEAKKLIALH